MTDSHHLVSFGMPPGVRALLEAGMTLRISPLADRQELPDAKPEPEILLMRLGRSG